MLSDWPLRSCDQPKVIPAAFPTSWTSGTWRFQDHLVIPRNAQGAKSYHHQTGRDNGKTGPSFIVQSRCFHLGAPGEEDQEPRRKRSRNSRGGPHPSIIRSSDLIIFPPSSFPHHMTRYYSSHDPSHDSSDFSSCKHQINIPTLTSDWESCASVIRSNQSKYTVNIDRSEQTDCLCTHAAPSQPFPL